MTQSEQERLTQVNDLKNMTSLHYERKLNHRDPYDNSCRFVLNADFQVNLTIFLKALGLILSNFYQIF